MPDESSYQVMQRLDRERRAALEKKTPVVETGAELKPSACNTEHTKEMQMNVLPQTEGHGYGWHAHRVLTCAGNFDTNIERPGKDYLTLSLGEIFANTEPASVVKKLAPAVVCSTYHAYNGREHDAQRQHGMYVALPGDIDEGDTPLEVVVEAVAEFTGPGVAWLIYSTSSSTPSSRRWRILIPLAQPLPFAEWNALCLAFYAFLEGRGMSMDDSLARAAQLAYLPNVPPEHRHKDGTSKHYVHEVQDGRGLEMDDGLVRLHLDEWIARRDAEEAKKVEAKAKAQKERELRRVERKAGEDVSVIDAFNAKHSIEELLIANGYEQSSRDDCDWRSPYQTGGTYATRVFGDYWVSLSGSDRTARLGAEAGSGFGGSGIRYGDAFDIYCHFDHGGNFSAAVKAAAVELGIAQAPVGKSHADIVATIDAAVYAGFDPVQLSDAVVPVIAEARSLKPAEVEDLLKRVKDACGLSLKTLRLELAEAKQVASDGSDDDISIEWPVPTARAFLKSFYLSADNVYKLRFYQDEFYAWTGARYRPITTADVRAKIYKLFERAEVGVPNRAAVDNVVDALKAMTNVPSILQMPGWLMQNPPAKAVDLVALRNGLLHLPTGELLNHDPRFFSTDAANVDFIADAPAPANWLQFLAQAFPNDPESIEALQQWFGYLLTTDTSQQKALICVGPKRCGKGTIARVLRALLGEHNYAGPSLAQLGKEFGLQGLISKKVAVVSDARVSGQADLQAISENLLRITGEDGISVPRKGIVDWMGTLYTRFVLLTNILPGIIDGGGAVASRFIVIKFTQSFFGKEDPKLTQKLLAELPGILNWALEGLGKLQARGAFIQPESGLAAVEELERKTTPIIGFIRDVLELAPEVEAAKDDVYFCYRLWCDDEGLKFRLSKAGCFTDIYANGDGRIAPGVAYVKGSDGKRQQIQVIKGGKIKSEWVARMTSATKLLDADHGDDFDIA
jgi:P4 family phage/plasmid primase-like protien